MSDPSNQSDQNSGNPHESPRRPGPLQVIYSIAAALFGVQSQKNRERDFTSGDPRDYILVYVLAVVGLVIGMIVVVSIALSGVQ